MTGRTAHAKMRQKALCRWRSCWGNGRVFSWSGGEAGEFDAYLLKHAEAEAVLDSHPEHYATLVDRQIGRNDSLGIILTNLFYHLPQLCFALGVRNPFVTRALVNMLADRIGYGRVILSLFGTLLLFLLSETVAGLAKLIGGVKAMNRVREVVYSSIYSHLQREAGKPNRF